MRHDHISSISTMTIDGEAFVKGDEVIPESLIEREFGPAYRGVLGSLHVFYFGSALYKPITLLQYPYTAKYLVRHGCR